MVRRPLAPARDSHCSFECEPRREKLAANGDETQGDETYVSALSQSHARTYARLNLTHMYNTGYTHYF